MPEAASGDAWTDAARAIMTTDTYPKLTTAKLAGIGDGSARLSGIAKGAGMIAPDMATMLSYMATDLAIVAAAAAGRSYPPPPT